MVDDRRPRNRSNTRNRAEGNHAAGSSGAHVILIDRIGFGPKLRLSLNNHAVITVKRIKVVHVGAAQGRLQGRKDIARLDAQ